jgi:ADP-heptose:LPS heptosyltransferase
MNVRAPVLNLVGETDLGKFLAVIDQLSLLVTNDTGASHLAAATKTPSVVLFGPSRPARWAPLDRTLHTVLDARDFAADPMSDDEWLAHLPLEPVLEACCSALVGAGTGARAAHPNAYRAEVGA